MNACSTAHLGTHERRRDNADLLGRFGPQGARGPRLTGPTGLPASSHQPVRHGASTAGESQGSRGSGSLQAAADVVGSTGETDATGSPATIAEPSARGANDDPTGRTVFPLILSRRVGTFS